MRAKAMSKTETTIVVIFVGLTILFPNMVKSQTFDNFWFVQQWPLAVCGFQSGRCVGQGLRSFTIHGVWPQKGGSSVTNCPGNTFDFTKIAHLENDLNVAWPNLITGNNKWFWGHEWNKHGICSEGKFAQAAYFQMALNMRNNHNIMNALRVRGVGPNGRSKAKQAVESALRAQFGTDPVLRCRTKTTTSQIFLVEIVLCFDDDGVTLINCNKASSNCANSFIF